ncbi:MAG TPA: hypothetical protein VGE29_16260, partial [Prosthecobacter sp.]
MMEQCWNTVCTIFGTVSIKPGQANGTDLPDAAAASIDAGMPDTLRQILASESPLSDIVVKGWVRT